MGQTYHYAKAACLLLLLAPAWVHAQEGPIEGPIEGPLEGPIEGPMEGPIEGPLEGPIEGPIEGPVEGGAAPSARVSLEPGDTGLRGRVTDGESDDAPMAAVMVEVVEAQQTAMTDGEGRYEIALAPGAYTLRIFTDFYLPVRLEGVDVRATEITDVPDTSLRLDSGAMLDAVVVTGRANTNSAATQLQVRRQAAGVQDAVSADEISRSGDSSAGSAARRVVATTIVGGQYLYVRGLGGRYTNVLLNGATLPQLDTNLSGVQLDLFPSFALASISIRKSYTPDLPGAFGGGTALLTTREFPEEFEVNVGLGLSYNSETTFRRGQVHRGGRFDLLGFGDGSRDLTSSLDGRALRLDVIRDRDERLAVQREFRDDLEVNEQRQSIAPIDKLSLRVGNRFDLGANVDLGVIAAAGWSLDRQRRQEVLRRGTFLDDTVEVRQEQDRESFSRTGRLAALGSASLLLGDDHEIGFTTLFNQIGEEYTGTAVGLILQLDRGDSFRQRQSWVERQIWFNQLQGRHYMGSARLSWQAYTTGYHREQPDTRDFRYAPRPPPEEGEDPEAPWPDGPWPDNSRFVWVDRQPVSGQRLFINTGGRDFGASADLEYDVNQLGRYKFRAGVATHRTTQDLSIRRFDYRRVSTPSDPSAYRRPPQFLFADEQAGQSWNLTEITNPEDSYDAQENLFAGHVSAQVEVSEWLRLFAGVRVEAFRQQLLPLALFAEEGASNEDDRVFRTDIDVLPAATAVFTLRENMYVRGGYSVTVARPRARELSGAVFPDFINNRTLFGDPNVQRTRIQHADLRWEWFPGSTEVVAVSAFAKFFDQPIELTILDSNRTVSFRNVDSARNLGVEFELRAGLGHLADALDDFQLGANLTLVSSRATLSEAQAAVAFSDERPLAYQSPWVVNANLGYDPDDSKFSAFLFYNVAGRFLFEAGAQLPDTYQEPFHNLELLLRYDMTESVGLSLRGRNLLNDTQEFRQGDLVLRSYRPGVDVSLSIGWTH